MSEISAKTTDRPLIAVSQSIFARPDGARCDGLERKSQKLHLK